MDGLPELVLLKIGEYLSYRECINLSMTCRRLRNVLPKFVLIKGEEFKIHGPNGGHWCPEFYFDGPTMKGKVKRFRASVRWKDQGWGNRKGRLMVKLMRRVSDEKKVVAENTNLFGIVPRPEDTSECCLVNDPVVQLAEPGDYYSFERNAGGGGGHTLKVKNFRVVLELSNYSNESTGMYSGC